MLKKLFRIFCASLFSLGIAASAWAALAPKHPMTVKDADGTTLAIRWHGDEFINWATLSTDAAPMVARSVDGNWYFAIGWEMKKNQAVVGTVRAAFGLAPKQTLTTPPQSAIDKARQQRNMFRSGSKDMSRKTVFGVSPRPVLVFNVEYTGTPVGAPRPSEEEVASYFFGSGTRSVKDYWAGLGGSIVPGRETSGTPDNGVINVTIQGSVPYKPQGDDLGTLVISPILETAGSSINLAQYDANGDGFLSGYEVQLVFFLTEDEGTGVWPCAFLPENTYNLTTVQGLAIGTGTFVGSGVQSGEMDPMGTALHEMGHSCWNMWDVYDYSIWNGGIVSPMMGNWSLMANNAWFVRPDAWNLIWSGLATPQEMSTRQNFDLSAKSGIVRIPSSDPKRYLLAEVRQASGNDAHLSSSIIDMAANQAGLLLLMVDEYQQDNSSEENPMVAVLEAHGGMQHLRTDEASGNANGGDVRDLFGVGGVNCSTTSDPKAPWDRGSVTQVSSGSASMQALANGEDGPAPTITPTVTPTTEPTVAPTTGPTSTPSSGGSGGGCNAGFGGTALLLIPAMLMVRRR